jgi:hypothetical protein
VFAGYAYPEREEQWAIDLYKGTVLMTPSDTTTSGTVDITIEVPADETDRKIVFVDDEDDLYEYFFDEGGASRLFPTGWSAAGETGNRIG